MPATPLALLVDGGDGAGDVGAVPARSWPAAAWPHSPAAYQSPWSLGVGVAAVAVARGGGVGDEVVAGEDIGGEVGVGGDAGVDHGDRDAGAGGDVPGAGTFMPLACGEVPLLAVLGVVRRQHGLHRVSGSAYVDLLRTRQSRVMKSLAAWPERASSEAISVPPVARARSSFTLTPCCRAALPQALARPSGVALPGGLLEAHDELVCTPRPRLTSCTGSVIFVGGDAVRRRRARRSPG